MMLRFFIFSGLLLAHFVWAAPVGLDGCIVPLRGGQRLALYDSAFQTPKVFVDSTLQVRSSPFESTSPNGQFRIERREDTYWVVQQTGETPVATVLVTVAQDDVQPTFKWAPNSHSLAIFWPSDDGVSNAVWIWQSHRPDLFALPTFNHKKLAVSDVHFLNNGNWILDYRGFRDQQSDGDRTYRSGFEIVDANNRVVVHSTLRSLVWQGLVPHWVRIKGYRPPYDPEVHISYEHAGDRKLADLRRASVIVNRLLTPDNTALITFYANGTLEVFDLPNLSLSKRIGIESPLRIQPHEWIGSLQAVVADDAKSLAVFAKVHGRFVSYGRLGGGRVTQMRERLLLVDLHTLNAETFSSLVQPSDHVSTETIPRNDPFLAGLTFPVVKSQGLDRETEANLRLAADGHSFVLQLSRQKARLGISEVFSRPH